MEAMMLMFAFGAMGLVAAALRGVEILIVRMMEVK